MSSNANGRNSKQKKVLKHELMSKHGSVCQICKKRFSIAVLTLDHIVPLALGGTWHIKNLQLACYDCNQEKSDTVYDPWSIFDK